MRLLLVCVALAALTKILSPSLSSRAADCDLIVTAQTDFNIYVADLFCCFIINLYITAAAFSTQRLADHQYTVCFIDNNICAGCHCWQQFTFRVGYIYINGVINNIIFGNSFTGYQSYYTFKCSVRIGINCKVYFLPYFYLSDIRFINHGFDMLYLSRLAIDMMT